MKVQSMFLVMILFLVHSCDSDRKLYLLDLYTCVEEYEEYCRDIPRLTVRAATEIANNRTDMLPGYKLSVLNATRYPNKSLLLDGEAILTARILRNFNEQLRNATVSPIVLGSPFSFISEYAVSILGGKQRFSLINFKSTLGNLSESSFFYRIGPNEAFFNVVRHRLLSNNNWTRVGLLSSSGMYSLTAELLATELVNDNFTIFNMASFVIRGDINGSTWNLGQLDELKDEDIRIIVALLPLVEVPLVICTAREIGLVDNHHVWILPEINLNDTRRVAENYTLCNVTDVLTNALMVGENYNSDENDIGVEELDELLMKYYNISSKADLMDTPGYNLSRVVFDAAWAAILALNNSIQPLKDKNMTLDMSVDNRGIVNQTISDIIKLSLNQVNFTGLSGRVNFRNNSLIKRSRLMTSGTLDTASVSQIINGTPCTVEVYRAINETELDSSAGFCNYTWGNNPPTSTGLIDYPHVPAALLVFTIVATAVFVSIALALIIITIAMRKNKFVRTSSVAITIAITLGCVLTSMSSIPPILIYGAKQYQINDMQFITLCQLNTFLERFGYTLIFVFLLLKTWRLYQIQTNKLLKKKIRFISDKALFIFALILLTPMVLLTLIEAIFCGPVVGTTRVETEGRYPYNFIEYSHCKRLDAWDIIIYVYHVLITVCILCQAGHVSQMKIKKLALEGDTSVRLLLLLVVFFLCHFIIMEIFSYNDNFFAVLIISILSALNFSVLTSLMIFVPKVYLILNDYYMQAAAAKASKPQC